MKAIVVVDRHWGIGRNGGLLFRLPQDMRFFRQRTQGATVVMGRKTFESLPNGPLAGRVNVVLSRSGKLASSDDNVVWVKTIDALLRELKKHDRVFVIGGGEVYRLLMPFCAEAIVTKVDADGDAEVFLDNLDNAPNWRLASQSDPFTDNGFTTRRCVYVNDNVTQF